MVAWTQQTEPCLTHKMHYNTDIPKLAQALHLPHGYAAFHIMDNVLDLANKDI